MILIFLVCLLSSAASAAELSFAVAHVPDELLETLHPFILRSIMDDDTSPIEIEAPVIKIEVSVLQSKVLQSKVLQSKPKKKYECEKCGESFINNFTLNRHINETLIHGAPRVFPCDHEGCERTFTSKDALNRHDKTHNPVRHGCNFCQISRSSKQLLVKHMLKCHFDNNK